MIRLPLPSSAAQSDRSGAVNPRRPVPWGLVLLGLAAVSAVCFFYRLGKKEFNVDEGLYTGVVDNIVASGDWIHLHNEPGVSYLRKPPLYFWITAATVPLTDGGRWAYRFWSAVFGIGCVLLTAVLGRRLFGPGVGVLAALALITNRSFVGYHGVKSACMDSALTLFALLSFLLWWDMRERGRRWARWVLIGLCAGAGHMLKTLGGLPALMTVGAHALFFDRGAPLWKRLAAPALALAVSVAVAAPWHISQWQIHGEQYTYYSFEQNVIERATVGLDPWHVKGPLFYLQSVTQSGYAFFLALPALAYAAWRARRGPGAESYRLLVVPAALFIGTLSLAKSKLDWYLYPAYPLIALAVAALVWEWTPRLTAAVKKVRRSVLRRLGRAAASNRSSTPV